MGSLMAPSHLTLSDLERSKSRSQRFHNLISRKGASKLGRMLLLNINRKPYTGSLMVSSHSPWSDLKKVKFKVNQTFSGRGTIWYIFPNSVLPS